MALRKKAPEISRRQIATVVDRLDALLSTVKPDGQSHVSVHKDQMTELRRIRMDLDSMSGEYKRGDKGFGQKRD